MRAILSLAIAIAACGSPPPPREYPRLNDQPDRASRREREPLRARPRLIVQADSSPVVTFRVTFDAGSASDPQGHEGATLLAARLMAEGGAGELSYAQLSQRLYPLAGTIDVHVGRDETSFVGQVHRDHVDAFYELFRDVLLRPRMGAQDFVRIRDQMRNELTVDLRNAEDEQLGKEALQAFLYEGHPYAHPPLGTERGLARMRVDDVRAQRNRVFCAGRMAIGIAGQIPSELSPRIERDLSALRSDACVGREALPAPSSVRAPSILIVDKPEAQAVAVSMGFPIEVRRDHPDYPALTLAAAWLGQHRQFVGRLMQGIRGQRGLNYGDYSYAEHFAQEGGTTFPIANDSRRQQYFSIWLRPLRPSTAHFAIRFAVRELRLFIERGLTTEQLEQLRTFADAYYPLYQQTSSRRLGYTMDDAFYGVNQAWVERLRAAWRGMTAEQLNAAIRRHLRPEQLRIAIVASDAQALAQAIASEAESPVTYQATVPDTVLAEDREIVRYRLGIPRDRIRIVPVARMFAE